LPVFLSLVDTLASWRGVEKHLPKATMEDIADRLLATRDVLPYKLARRLGEDEIDLLKRLVFCLWHEQNLVEPANHCNATVETKSQARLCHSVLHCAEIVRHDKAAQK